MTGTWACPPKSILVAVDFGDASARALEIAGVIASGFNASIRVVHAERFEPPMYFTLEQIARLEDQRQDAQAQALTHLQDFAARATARPVEPVVVDGPPVEAILSAAAGADLIVMGTHGRRGPGRWWLGSVAERVVRAATVPVLVTRAAQSPVGDVFRDITVVREGVENGAKACAQALAAISGGRVVEGGTTASCGLDRVRQSSLVVVVLGDERRSWALTDPTAKLLTSCHAPVLFIPGHD